MRRASIYVLLGGFTGFDGWVTSRGMLSLASRLEQAFPECLVRSYAWGSAQEVADDMRPSRPSVLVGYSGGAMSAVQIATARPARPVELMVLYDPSPPGYFAAAPPLGDNVRRCVTYENSAPLFLGYGGGVVRGPRVERVHVSMWHPAVQASRELHERTVGLVREALS